MLNNICFCSVWQLFTWFTGFSMLHKLWGLKTAFSLSGITSVDVTMLTHPNFQWKSDDIMVLGHTDMFNKYCLWAAPSISFLSGIGLFYGGTLLQLAILLHRVCSHQQNISSFIALYCYCSELFVITIIDNLCFNLPWHKLTCSVCDLSVCSRSWRAVSSFPTHCQLPALVLYPAFLWGAAARSHHLCGILHC